MRTLFVAVALLVCIAVSASAQNLVVNGGFENAPSPGIPDEPIPGWTMVDEGWDDMRGFHWTLQDEVVNSGNYALKMHLENAPNGWGAGWGIHQTINITYNRVYEIRARWKYEGNESETYMSLFAYPGTWYEGSDVNTVYALRSTTSTGGYPAFLPMPFEWESTLNAPGPVTSQFRGRYKSPSPFETQLTLYFRMTTITNEGAAFYIDDVEVVDVEAAFELSGTVKNASNVPIAGATVTVSTGGSAVTDATGSYKIYFPNAGAATVTASHPQYFDSAVAKTITARQNNTQSFNLTLRPVGTLSGVVTDGVNPLANATVSTTTGGYTTTTNESGGYSMVVVEGGYTLEAVATGYLKQSVPVTVTAGQTTTTNFPLEMRYVNPANALTNGDFEAGVLAPWTPWLGTHFTYHKTIDPGCVYKDQWIGVAGSTNSILVLGQGYQGSAGALVGLWADVEPGTKIGWGANGGLRQECYVTPGKYYRVRAMFKGSVSSDANYEFALGLVNGRFDPGVYSDGSNPPPFAHDVFMISCGRENALNMMDHVPDGYRWWENIMASRSSGRHPRASWGWESTMDYIAPRNYIAGATRQATGEIMTVVLYTNTIRWDTVDPQYAIFDNVVLEEVPAPTAALSLGDLSKCDLSPPWAEFADEIQGGVNVDLSNPMNAKIVTGVFDTPDGPVYYIEEMDRSAGIRVEMLYYDHLPAPQTSDLVTLVGKLRMNAAGERAIFTDVGSHQTVGISPELPRPIGLNTKSASAKLRYANPLAQIVGPVNTGLLARVTGRVATWFYAGSSIAVMLEDGSGAEFWVVGVPIEPGFGDQIVATGIISIDTEVTGVPVMCLRMRPETAMSDFYVVDTSGAR